MHLVIVHHHFRPGGVRRVIELAAPALARSLAPPVRQVVLVGGEAPEAGWLDRLRHRLGPIPVQVLASRVAGYATDQPLPPARRRQRIRRLLARLAASVSGEGCVVWLHNPGLGRNLVLNAELVRLCTARHWPLVFHHHDWWFDHRWRRWQEMRRAGGGTLRQVAQRILPGDLPVRHVAINQADARRLRRHFGDRAAWWPNPGEATSRPAAVRVSRARSWLQREIGEVAPVWLVPARLLRRKNVAEALLLARWLRPEAWLATTGGASSSNEAAYAHALATAAREEGWKLRLGLLARGEQEKPAVPDLLAGAEAVLLTSLKEGFGLPFLEVSAAGRPFIGRRIPDVAPDLAHGGFEFPQLYADLRVDPRLFDHAAEFARQEELFAHWRRSLPRTCRSIAEPPALLAGGDPAGAVPFSRLTLHAQLEVLRHPAEDSWALCVTLNPFLEAWRKLASRGALRASVWPATASAWLSGPAYARRFAALLRARPARHLPRAAPIRTQLDFLRTKLRTENAYPLLWGA
ncbi:MAG: glycosyltransferase [Verrucomicrobia bacterium]|nr:glycosyltransferase [Verrucomicrobiota bacterium]